MIIMLIQIIARLAIMVRGSFQCLGGSQNLKLSMKINFLWGILCCPKSVLHQCTLIITICQQGGPQHIKSKFGKGFQIIIKVGSSVTILFSCSPDTFLSYILHHSVPSYSCSIYFSPFHRLIIIKVGVLPSYFPVHQICIFHNFFISSPVSLPNYSYFSPFHRLIIIKVGVLPSYFHVHQICSFIISSSFPQFHYQTNLFFIISSSSSRLECYQPIPVHVTRYFHHSPSLSRCLRQSMALAMDIKRKQQRLFRTRTLPWNF